MKKIIVAMCLLSMLMLTSCYTVRILSDADREITIASKTENLPLKERYRVWYALWGLVPISDNTTNKIFKESKIKKARITTKMTFVDWLISVVLGQFSIVTWTVEVEGAE